MKKFLLLFLLLAAPASAQTKEPVLDTSLLDSKTLLIKTQGDYTGAETKDSFTEIIGRRQPDKQVFTDNAGRILTRYWDKDTFGGENNLYKVNYATSSLVDFNRLYPLEAQTTSRGNWQDWFNLTVQATSTYPISDHGWIYAGNAAWATVRAATTGTYSGVAPDYVGSENVAAVYYIYKIFYNYDTSDLSGSTVDNANLFLYPVARSDYNGDTVEIRGGSQSVPVVADDFDQCTGATSTPDIDFADFTLNLYSESALSPSAINTTGTTKICLRSRLDYDNITPAAGQRGYITFAGSFLEVQRVEDLPQECEPVSCTSTPILSEDTEVDDDLYVYLFETMAAVLIFFGVMIALMRLYKRLVKGKSITQ